MTEIELRQKKGLIQIGVSKGVILPRVWLNELGWADNDQLYLEMVNGVIKIWKVDNDVK